MPLWDKLHLPHDSVLDKRKRLDGWIDGFMGWMSGMNKPRRTLVNGILV